MNKLEVNPAEIQQFLKSLAEAPRRITAATKGLTDAQLNRRTAKEPWSVNDILAHLCASADVRGKFILAILAQDHPTLRYISPRSYIKKTNYPELAFSESFAAYNKQRNELLNTLKPLSLGGWIRSAVIEGRAREESVFSYTRSLTQHETVHCEQIEVLLK